MQTFEAERILYGRMFHLPIILRKKLFLSTFVIANLISTLNSFKFVSVSLCERRPDNRTVFQIRSDKGTKQGL